MMIIFFFRTCMSETGTEEDLSTKRERRAEYIVMAADADGKTFSCWEWRRNIYKESMIRV